MMHSYFLRGVTLTQGAPLLLTSSYLFTGTAGQDYFAPLDQLEISPHYQPIGGQNFTRCCLQALKDWKDQAPDAANAVTVYDNKNPQLAFKSAEELSNSNEQFPCGATYNNDASGAATVFITYDWCSTHCGGWQQSTNKALTQWVQPFVGFILPAAVFCLNVPRKMVVDIADELFPDVLEQLKYSWIYLIEYERRGAAYSDAIVALAKLLLEVVVNLALVAFRAVIAASLGLLNVVVWVVVVFSTAAPMIISGLYEATTDRQVLHAIERRVRPWKIKHIEDAKQPANDVSKIPYQIHMLYAILVGNLELRKAKEDVESGASGSHNHTAAWLHVEKLVETLQDSTDPVERAVTQTRLQTMLQCQADFGASIGAPVAFFLGSFLFSIFSNYSTLGDNDTSHALAFGEWWMTIPHIAIVGGCLLAGNNPNTLEAIVSGVRLDRRQRDTSVAAGEAAGPSSSAETTTQEQALVSMGTTVAHTVRGLSKSYTPFYKSVYQPVWMWERGRSKRNWIRAVQAKHPQQPEVAHPSEETSNRHDNKTIKGWVRRLASREAHPLEKVPSLGPTWMILILTASILIIIPWVLAYITSYYTPTIGLSCRTFTFVMYFIFQLILAAIWFYDFPRDTHTPLYTEQGWPTPFYVVTLLAFCGAAFTAIVGTFLQIVGVYRNCKCFVPMSVWGIGSYSFIISNNSAEMIYYANLYWPGGGIASIVLLILFCYMGWWYQRHWRLRFNKVVRDVLMTNTQEELDRLGSEVNLERQRKAASQAAMIQTGVPQVSEHAQKEEMSSAISPSGTDSATAVPKTIEG